MAILEVRVPDVGSDDPVDVIEISVNLGGTIEEEQTLLVVESAKATIEVPAPMAGTISEICTGVGKQVKTGDLIFKVQVSDVDNDAPEAASTAQTSPESTNFKKQPAAEKQFSNVENNDKPTEPPVPSSQMATVACEPDRAKTQPQPTQKTAQLSLTQEVVHAGPAVRRLANQLGADLSKVEGSGPKHRILKEDVHGFVKEQMTAGDQGGQPSRMQLPKFDFTQWGEVTEQPLTKIQSLSAKNLQRAWQLIPHVTQFDEANINELEAFRVEENKRLKSRDVKLTLLAFIMKACANALKAFPKFCASYDDGSNQIVYKKYCHIGFAADTENGLVVPVIRDVDQKSLIEIAAELTELSARAREKKLKPQEMQGGCFTVSSLGGIGGTGFTPIVNWPEVAILGVSRSQQKVVLANGDCTHQLTLPLSLSYDHRVIDGADAARFTAYLAGLLSDIRRVLL